MVNLLTIQPSVSQFNSFILLDPYEWYMRYKLCNIFSYCTNNKSGRPKLDHCVCRQQTACRINIRLGINNCLHIHINNLKKKEIHVQSWCLTINYRLTNYRYFHSMIIFVPSLEGLF